MRLLSGFLADAHLSDLSARIAGRILSMARSFGVQDENGVHLSIRITQGELALMVGGARQSVNKILQQLDEQGIVSNRSGRLTVHSFDELRLRAREERDEVA
ncbi:helix-turn-helix domain-containing protein [Sphingobium sp. SCG-1]|uniref:helix-turn-helix domain-containing protein n=1 Tax=Sphingobium sp. SCG-1 TaxID=2072936 RepID=UPI001CB97413|nr:helix-turn-helix domain-containing protein [Sphingobium sp. SCG-1]